jgi:hypothetical protein
MLEDTAQGGEILSSHLRSKYWHSRPAVTFFLSAFLVVCTPRKSGFTFYTPLTGSTLSIRSPGDLSLLQGADVSVEQFKSLIIHDSHRKMARYQLRRPTPVKIVPRRVRRQATTASSASAAAASEMPEAEEPEEEEEGPESPDSPESSPSTVGAGSESEDSDSDDDEPPSPIESSAPPTASQAAISGQPMLPSMPASSAVSMPIAISSAAASMPASSGPARPNTTVAASSAPSQMPVAQPAFTASFSSQGNAAAAPPQGTATSSMTTTTRSPSTTPLVPSVVPSLSVNPPNLSSSVTSPSPNVPLAPAQSETAGQTEVPQRSSPHEHPTMITKGGVAAAVTLSIIGKNITPFMPL